MVKHIVMFKLSGTPAERLDVATAFKNALEALPEQIEVLRTIEVGLNQNPAEDWDVVLTAIVDIPPTWPPPLFWPDTRNSAPVLTISSDRFDAVYRPK